MFDSIFTSCLNRSFLFLLCLPVVLVVGCDSRKASHQQQDIHAETLAQAVHSQRLVLDPKRSSVTLSGFTVKTGIWQTTVPAINANFADRAGKLHLNWDIDLRKASFPVASLQKAFDEALDRSISVQWRLAGAVDDFVFPELFPAQVTTYALQRNIWLMLYGNQSQRQITIRIDSDGKSIRVRPHGAVNMSMTDAGMQRLMGAMVKHGLGKPSRLLSVLFDLVFVPQKTS